MNIPKASLIAVICLAAIWFGYHWYRTWSDSRTAVSRRPGVWHLLVGFITNFFDTFGISSFATTTAAFRLRRMVPDECIPGTLNIGHTPPTVVQALIFIVAVAVDPALLIAMIVSAVLGAWLGAGIVVRLKRRMVQVGLGGALAIAGTVFAMVNLNLLPGGGDSFSLEGWKFATAVAFNFLFGALMPLGVGLFGPCMVTLALLGMNPLAAFPVMMGSCALLMPVASARFLQMNRYSEPAALGLAIAGVPAVLFAAYVVKSLPVTAIRWLVVVVVLYAAFSLLRSALAHPNARSLADSGPDKLLMQDREK